jgi:hypothetical protein
MFADDTFCLKSDANINKLITDINIEINKMAVWFRANKLAVNINKTKFMIFRGTGKKINDDIPNLLYNENELGVQNDPNLISILERYHDNHENSNCRAYKLLGIYLDEHLNFNFHTKHLSNKLARSMYCIKQAKTFLTPDALRSLYYALIHSHLSYCPIILGCLNAKNLKQLEKVQKKAIRIITKNTYNAHTGPIFKQLKILPLEKIILQAKLHFMHSIEFNYAPQSFDEIWTKNNVVLQNYNLRQMDKYALPYPRIEFFKKIPIYSLPKEWNNIGDLTFQSNKNLFRNLLKEKLIEDIQI